MKKQIGVWLDFKEAAVIELAGAKAMVERVLSNIEDFHPHGGARSKTPWGPMDKMSEGKYLERRKSQEKAYFQKIIAAVREADELYIFGPAEAKDRFANAVKQKKGFRALLRKIERADSMTENQKVAQVRDFFGSQS